MTLEHGSSPEIAVTKTLLKFMVGSKIVRLRTVKGALPPFYKDDDGILRTSVVVGPNQRTRFMLDIDERTSK